MLRVLSLEGAARHRAAWHLQEHPCSQHGVLPSKLCLLHAAYDAPYPYPKTLHPGAEQQGSSPRVALPAAIHSVGSWHRLTAHFTGRADFTIVCSRGNLIQNNRLFFWRANPCILIPICASLTLCLFPPPVSLISIFQPQHLRCCCSHLTLSLGDGGTHHELGISHSSALGLSINAIHLL